MRNDTFTSWADYFAETFVNYAINESTNQITSIINGLDSLNIHVGTGSNKISLTVNNGLNLVGADVEDERNQVIVNGAYPN